MAGRVHGRWQVGGESSQAGAGQTVAATGPRDGLLLPSAGKQQKHYCSEGGCSSFLWRRVLALLEAVGTGLSVTHLRRSLATSASPPKPDLRTRNPCLPIKCSTRLLQRWPVQIGGWERGVQQ